ncbi:chorismate synthase [Rickettsiales bacterium LUAb2]
MANNSFGNYFNITTFGESHGSALGVIIDGVPANIPLSIDDIQPFLDKRKPGTNNYTSPRKERDKVEILSGVFEGKTIGTPITLIIYNHDIQSKDYSDIKDKFRPNHGDYTWQNKFGIRDYRGGGRSSARETAARVAAYGVANKILSYLNIKIYGALVQIGNLAINYNNWDYNFITQNIFSSPDSNIISSWENLINELKEEGDSIGAKIEIHVKNMPIGLGEPIFDKLDAEIAKAIMSIPAVKAVEIGIGADAVLKRGSEISDEMDISSTGIPIFKTNYSGGIQAGISNGNDLIVKLTVKPTSSIKIPKQSLNKSLIPTEVVTIGRHDPCVGLRAVPVAEAMIGIVLADFILRDRARSNYINNPLNKIS